MQISLKIIFSFLLLAATLTGCANTANGVGQDTQENVASMRNAINNN